MNFKNNKMKLLTLPLAVLLTATAFVGCGSESSESQDPNLQFTFAGAETEFENGKTFRSTIVGYKDNTFSLTVDELPAAKLDGTWTLVEGKGYKFYFNDANSLLSYTTYDATSKDFTLSYRLNLGSGYGTSKVIYTMHDESFASAYDGVGLGKVPPTFSGIGYSGGQATSEATTIIVGKEDGTVEQDTYYRNHCYRNGTWEYIQTTDHPDCYYFHFEDYSDDAIGLLDFRRNCTDQGSSAESTEQDGYVDYKCVTGYGVKNNFIYGDSHTEDPADPNYHNRQYMTEIYADYNAETGMYEATFSGITDCYVWFACTYEA